MPLNRDFKPATWLGTTNTDGVVIGVSFNLPDGAVVRYSLDIESARLMAESVMDYLVAGRVSVQSDNSSGNPKSDGSPQEGQ